MLLAIRQTLDVFEVMTDRGMITAVGISQLVKVLEKEFNIDVYDYALEAKAEEMDTEIELFEDKVHKVQQELGELRTNYTNLRKQIKDGKS